MLFLSAVPALKAPGYFQEPLRGYDTYSSEAQARGVFGSHAALKRRSSTKTLGIKTCLRLT